MEGESAVTPTIIDELHSLDIQGDQMECDSGLTQSINNELQSLDNQADQTSGKSGVTQSVIDEFIVGISNEIIWNLKVV